MFDKFIDVFKKKSPFRRFLMETEKNMSFYQQNMENRKLFISAVSFCRFDKNPRPMLDPNRCHICLVTFEN